MNRPAPGSAARPRPSVDVPLAVILGYPQRSGKSCRRDSQQAVPVRASRLPQSIQRPAIPDIWIPEVKYRCAAKKSTSSGAIITVEAAIIRFQLVE